jgi:hypothetical protein
MNIKISPYKYTQTNLTRPVGLSPRIIDYKLNQMTNTLDENTKKQTLTKELSRKHSNSHKNISINHIDRLNA